MKKKKIPLRKCVACNEQKTKKELIRVVKTKENEFFVDFTGKANGRGAYICPKIECFNIAFKKDSFSRSFHVKVSDEIYEKLKKELTDYEK
ncbi:RNase P modulator RnpM [Helicovermis profundi]|uniref:YlxR family protein n=1 Tax=Helicovermis profundi TaxID=3065157 RepID=A0AAU9E9A6_9FIRM|nr:YlxR family protein [Clostridia bacterium S502]